MIRVSWAVLGGAVVLILQLAVCRFPDLERRYLIKGRVKKNAAFQIHTVYAMHIADINQTAELKCHCQLNFTRPNTNIFRALSQLIRQTIKSEENKMTIK